MNTLAFSIVIYLTFNVAVFLVYGWDKHAARSGGQRIRESTLLWLAFVGGSLGAITAQQALRHKTRKEPFRSILNAIVILHVGLTASIAIWPDWPLQLLGLAAGRP